MASGKKSGLTIGPPKNGCLRLVLMYAASLLALIGGAFILGSGLLSNLHLPGLPALGGGAIVSSQPASGAASTAGGTGGSYPGITISSRQATSPQDNATLTGWSTGAFYIVQPGDTLDSIAARFGLTANDLLQYNPGLTYTLQPDELIYLPFGTLLPGTGRKSGSP
jgi:hypothetical protein